jgi:hypothetical protein
MPAEQVIPGALYFFPRQGWHLTEPFECQRARLEPGNWRQAFPVKGHGPLSVVDQFLRQVQLLTEEPLRRPPLGLIQLNQERQLLGIRAWPPGTARGGGFPWSRSRFDHTNLLSGGLALFRGSFRRSRARFGHGISLPVSN